MTRKLPVSCVKNWHICFSLYIISLTFPGSQKHFLCIHLPIIFQALLCQCKRFPSSLFFLLPPSCGAYSDTHLGLLLYILKTIECNLLMNTSNQYFKMNQKYARLNWWNYFSIICHRRCKEMLLILRAVL